MTHALQRQRLTVYGDGTQTRSFQYVDDLVDGISRLMKVAYQRPVNLGNPGEYTILEVAKLVGELTGTDEPLAFHPLPVDDPRKRRPDIALAVRLLDWRPRIGLREGLQRTIEYFRDQLNIRDNTTTILEASK